MTSPAPANQETVWPCFLYPGKPLIFYAYDLDQQSELKSANTFQAWGRRGPDRQQAINLGVFYEDNDTKNAGF